MGRSQNLWTRVTNSLSVCQSIGLSCGCSSRGERNESFGLQDFRNLQVWKKAHELTLGIYGSTNNLPKDELFGLRSQMRRSAASIGTNIAEGCGRYGDGELSRFLLIAMGSASELEYQLLLCRDLNYLNVQLYSELDGKTRELKRMLATFINKLDTPRTRARFKETERLTD